MRVAVAINDPAGKRLAGAAAYDRSYEREQAGDARTVYRGRSGRRASLAEATEAFRAVLGEHLLAAYALGSFAHGGFSGLVSDVDLGLLLTNPSSPEDAERRKLSECRRLGCAHWACSLGATGTPDSS